MTARYIINTYGSVANAPDDLAITLKATDNTIILVNTRWIVYDRTRGDGGGLRWLLVLSIPRDDFWGDITGTKTNIAIVCGVVAVVFLAMVVGASYCITAPIRKLQNTMQAATLFDFTALQNGYMNERSLFSEISDMQDTFNKMLTKFAHAIQNNKNLTKGGQSTSANQAPNPSLSRVHVRQTVSGTESATGNV